ncbi:hypothetical protein [Burkholderia sp. MSMB1078WGS]|uniref:hypothetical protein n=1 Tax=Burkholderia sp. MSMB1078WGS TaxID=1637900 RepID=UPI0012E36442|nr:hypothetical protein [Burkholderia sp. MSMB1078WGS]
MPIVASAVLHATSLTHRHDVSTHATATSDRIAPRGAQRHGLRGGHGDDGQLADLDGARNGTVHLGRDARTDDMAATVDPPLHRTPRPKPILQDSER